jgi:rod shape-determining protein MreB and related proteins
VSIGPSKAAIHSTEEQYVDLDVEIYKNKIVLLKESERQTFTPTTNFSTTRLLIGTFLPAQDCLKAAVKAAGGAFWLGLGRSKLRIHPMEYLEGGLSEIEVRILKELGHGAGVKSVEIIVNGQAV